MKHKIEKNKSIAIDGPGGAGKSTVAKLLAEQLGYIYVDTGAMYRAYALYCVRKKIDMTDEHEILSVMDEVNIELKYIAGCQKIFLNDEDVTNLIRTELVTDGSSKVAVINELRQKLVALQKKIASENKVVMDGRDIGSHVIPDAGLKLYLDANASVRAERRLKEFQAKGIAADFEKVKEEIEERDRRDMNREFAPLIKTEDAIYMDTSYKTIQEVIDEILNYTKEMTMG